MFKVGDKVHIYRKIGDWQHGREIEKETHYQEKIVCKVKTPRLSHTHHDCCEVTSDQCELMTVPLQCIKHVNKKVTVILRGYNGK